MLRVGFGVAISARYDLPRVRFALSDPMDNSITSSDRLRLHSVLLLAGRAAVMNARVVRPGVGVGLVGCLGVWTLEALAPVSDTILIYGSRTGTADMVTWYLAKYLRWPDKGIG